MHPRATNLQRRSLGRSVSVWLTVLPFSNGVLGSDGSIFPKTNVKSGGPRSCHHLSIRNHTSGQAYPFPSLQECVELARIQAYGVGGGGISQPSNGVFDGDRFRPTNLKKNARAMHAHIVRVGKPSIRVLGPGQDPHLSFIAEDNKTRRPADSFLFSLWNRTDRLERIIEVPTIENLASLRNTPPIVRVRERLLFQVLSGNGPSFVVRHRCLPNDASCQNSWNASGVRTTHSGTAVRLT
jgi:hypothetical protein